jgi:sigma-B regulation protein RsbU (phosphoserine phosphatase)
METLSPVTLGTTLSFAYLGVGVMRGPLQKRLVDGAAIPRQPQRQFAFDLLLCLAAGIPVALFHRWAFGFPLGSGLSLLLGCLMAGFFLGLDTGLARERRNILQAQQRQPDSAPPARYAPMSRRFSLVALATSLFVVLVLAMVIARDFAWLAAMGQDAASLAAAERTVMLEVAFIMLVLLLLVGNLIISFSRNLQLLFRNETRVLEKVTRGDLSDLVPVATRDEFGVIAGHTNSMIGQLRHRIKLLTALKVAEEFQQHLLPKTAPTVPGVEVAGASVSCEETGGDYYDYFRLPGDLLGVLVADASDHGVGAALHMTTARALLRAAVRDYRDPEALLRQINTQLVRDIGDTGRFVSVFFVAIDVRGRQLHWVRAGHEPALLYDPREKRFTELTGDGTALGIEEAAVLVPNNLQGWQAGAILVLVTDGVRETRNSHGTMFGAERLRQVVREHAHQAADAIRDAILAACDAYRGAAPRHDDMTVVVVKLA